METEMSNRGGDGKEVAVAKRRSLRFSDLFVRIMAFVLSLAAALVLGLAKQTTVVSVKLVPTLPSLNVPATAKYHNLSALTFFVVANAIACSYGALSVILVLANRAGKKGGLAMSIIILDLLMVVLLASANGAAMAVGVIAYQGNSHVQWNKVCDVFGKFCGQVSAALVVSLLGSLSFLFLVMLGTLNFLKKNN